MNSLPTTVRVYKLSASGCLRQMQIPSNAAGKSSLKLRSKRRKSYFMQLCAMECLQIGTFGQSFGLLYQGTNWRRKPLPTRRGHVQRQFFMGFGRSIDYGSFQTPESLLSQTQ